MTASAIPSQPPPGRTSTLPPSVWSDIAAPEPSHAWSWAPPPEVSLKPPPVPSEHGRAPEADAPPPLERRPPPPETRQRAARHAAPAAAADEWRLVVVSAAGRGVWQMTIPRWSALPAALGLLVVFGASIWGGVAMRRQANAEEAGLPDRAFAALHGLSEPSARAVDYRLTKTQRWPNSPAAYRQYARRLGLGTRPAANLLLRGKISERWMRAAGGAEKLPGSLQWPVDEGRFVRGYGSGSGGYHLAVDIAGKTGWPVRASADGIVGYAGDGIRGYGNSVLVIHPGGWVTHYAHNSAIHVVPGQPVRRGEILADLGSTGISRGPHVHFELIWKGRNCDPVPLFRPGVRHGEGRVTVPRQAEWNAPGRPPGAVACDRRRSHPGGEDERPRMAHATPHSH